MNLHTPIVSVILFLCVQGLIAQDANSIAQAYDFPTKPGMQAWANLNGYREQLIACELPIAIAKTMTTKAFVETCLKYPLRGNEMLYRDSPQLIEMFWSNFYGFKELAGRKDAGACLLEAYTDFSKQLDKTMNSISEQSFMTGFMLRYVKLFTPEQKERLAIQSLRNSATMNNNPASQNLIIIPLSIALKLLIEDGVVIQNNGVSLDKTALPAAAFKYLKGESIGKEEANWCLEVMKIATPVAL